MQVNQSLRSDVDTIIAQLLKDINPYDSTANALKNIKLNDCVGRAVTFLAPSMFSVYILHQCWRGLGFVKFGMSLSDMTSGCAAIQTFLAAVVVFVTCIAIDIMFRRCVVMLLGTVRRL